MVDVFTLRFQIFWYLKYYGHPPGIFGIFYHTWSILSIYSQGMFYSFFPFSSFSSQTKSAKTLWFLVVCLGFIGAGILIGKSYKEWQDKPIATSITTHPIDDLDFPNVTICPPKNSNTALYHDLVKAGNGYLSGEHKKWLRKAAYDIFIEDTHKDYAEKMLVFSNMGNMDQVFQGFHSLPTPYNNEKGLKIKMWNLNGTITTPGFKADYVEEYYKGDKDILMVLVLPEDIKDQVGCGSLIIELETDIREEEGWVEEVALPTFTLHKTKKTWFEAESDCQKVGGHLASVASLEENQVVRNVMCDDYVWLGGKKTLGEWSWSDNSTWGFTDWTYSNGGDCLQSLEGRWKAIDCSETRSFICQKPSILRGEKTMSLAYTKDQLNFPNFLVKYKFKVVSQNLLDSWRDKRMTGFRLSWRIKSENPPFMARIHEVGRSIQTPHLNVKFDQVYKAIMIPSKELVQQMENGGLVIELETHMKTSDEAYAFTSYKLYREKMKWTEADLHCKSEGGQLASIHSLWEHTLAKNAAEGEYVWLGGRSLGGQWQWVDNNVTLSFTNWRCGSPESAEFLAMHDDGSWADYSKYSTSSFLCQGTTANLTENGLTRIELEKDQLSFFPFHVLFKSQAEVFTDIDQSTSKTVSEDARRISGFTLNWFLKDSHGTLMSEKLPSRKENWKQEVPSPVYQDLLFHDAVQLAGEFCLEDKKKEEILNNLIHAKTQGEIVIMSGLDEKCLMGQLKPEYRSALFSKLVSNTTNSKIGGHNTTEYIKFGYEIFYALVFCPENVFKLYSFIDNLISNEITRTIIQTIVNLFHSGAITDEKIFILAKRFYSVLATTLDLQYGNILMATSTTAQLQALIQNDLPFFLNYTDRLRDCLQKTNCDIVQQIYEYIGK